MIERPFSSTSDLERDSVDIAGGSFPFTATCSALKSKWLSKINANRQHISCLMRKILAEEAATSLENGISAGIIPSYTISERLQIQQRNSIHAISNLILVNSLSVTSPEQASSSFTDTRLHLIEWLKDRGYRSLATKLTSQIGYPWNEFEQIRSPILIEQLVDIYLLCIQKMPESDSDQNKAANQKIINFALHLARLATSSNLSNEYPRSYELIEDAKQVLGQLIYLINQDPHLAIKAIHTPLYQDALDHIKNEFSLQIKKICYHLQCYYIAHYETQLQDPEIALNTMIPVEIARALLTDIGTINVGIIDSLSDIFLSQDKRYINHQANLSYALKILQRSPKLRAEFEKIHQPFSAKIASHDVIKVSLGIVSDHPINELDTRLTVLIALLSHLRQGEDRSCFAVSLAIEILSAHLVFCFKDLRQLVEEGKITRHIKGIRKDIPFIKRISDENLHKKITFNGQGELIIKEQKKAPLWKAPGLLAVCRSIDLKNPQEAILAAIQQLPSPQNGENHIVEMKILIQKICEQAKLEHSPHHSVPLDQLYTLACFAFSSQTSQPLLKIWENAIANMAEAEEGSMVKTAILESTLDALQFKLGELGIPPSIFLQRFFLHIQKSLYEKICLQYDPAIQCHLEGNAYAKEGGFVLYHQKQRIDNEKAFRQFILDILLEVNSKMRKVSMSDIEKYECNQVFDILTPYIDSNEFMGYLLVRYHPSNKLAVSQLSHGQPLPYEQLQFTPWITQIGNNSKALLKIYFESTRPISTERFISTGAEEALINIIEMCKKMSEEEKRLYLDNPNKLKPLCILGKHRLPFMAGNPSLANAWQQQYPTKEWMNRFVIDPGREIAETLIESETKHTLIKRLQEDILPTTLSPDKIKSCMSLFEKIPEGLTIKQYRASILEICQNMHPQSTATTEKLKRQIDTMLCQSLEPSLKKKLEDSAVHFADTNWCSGIQDIHFCFAINPGTGELELWEAYANGEHLIALDQNYWLFNQKWEFMTIPEDLIPDDFSVLSDS
jgi:hypothetical protein